MFEESFIDSEVSNKTIFISFILINAQHCVCVAVADSCITACSFDEVDFDNIIGSFEPLHSVEQDDWQRFVNKL